MLKNKTPTYVSLFSSGGVGCYGFKMENYQCIATNEIKGRRLDVQRYNNKCKYESGYIEGDISNTEVKDKIYNEIGKWKKKGNDRVDVIIATPPCQGISVINHKKAGDEIKRNSLVVESVEIVKEIKPRFFIFENVQAFEKTLCVTNEDKIMPIGDYVREVLGKDYIISGRILNFMNYGSNSSRTRTLMIGVDKGYKNNITPYDLYPNYKKEKTLRDIIYDLPNLEWAEISNNDFYHAFRIYKSNMRDWIKDLKEGQSAFDNENPKNRPHRIIDGIRVENVKKARDKYTRQPWDRFIQCIHTRNDQLAAQNTLHPEQDRVFSIRELMKMMTIPEDFKWMELDVNELNKLPLNEKRAMYKTHEMNIRQCIGEAVPSEIFRQIAEKINGVLPLKKYESMETNKIINQYELINRKNLERFLSENPLKLGITTLMRITELCNAKREENAAFYTNKFIVNEIMDYLPTFSKKEIRILEPSVGAGGFLPFIFRKYENVQHVILDVVDIDEDSIHTLDLILDKISIPENFTINRICHDFLKWDINERYDLAIGNPPFSKLKKSNKIMKEYLVDNINQKTNNLSEFFLEKCLRHSDIVALVLNKTILSTGEFAETRDLLRKMKIDSIIDFGRYGFTGVSIETMCLIVYPNQKPKDTRVYSMKSQRSLLQAQSYITDETFPYFIIYRDDHFDIVASKLEFDVFSVFRDRQITKSLTSSLESENSLRVIKARNIKDDGSGIDSIENYDVYIDENRVEELSVYKYINNKNVYLTPNMTYNPRVIENLSDTVPDGSVAVLIPKSSFRLTEQQRKYFSTAEYRRFYGIARNLSTQSINVDKMSVFFYGVLKNDKEFTS